MKIKIISASLFLQFMTMAIGIQMAHGRMIFPMDTEYVLATLSWPKNMLAWLFRILSMTFQAVKIRGAMDPRAIFAENTWVWTFVTWLGITNWSVILRIFLKIHWKHQQSKRELIIQVVLIMRLVKTKIRFNARRSTRQRLEYFIKIAINRWRGYFTVNLGYLESRFLTWRLANNPQHVF